MCLSELPEKNVLESSLKEDRDRNNFLLQTVVLISITFSLGFFSVNVLTSLNQIHSQAGVCFVGKRISLFKFH